ncbi:MAG TPA: ribulokinase [Fimbriimonadaceae bacterium]|jgi:L-ribulokinase
MSLPSYAIGVDYGTSSVRALVVRTSDGAEIGTSVWPYAHGTDGVVLDPNNALLARQHAQDYVDGLIHAIRGALEEAKKDKDFSVDKVVGIGVDTTGSSPLPVDEHNIPLACKPEFANDPNAMTWLWKDHTSYAEAAEITSKSNELGFPYMKMVGGTYSSEWFWAKILHCARVAPKVFEAAYSWIELQDYVPAYLTGVKDIMDVKRGVCAAGHKALYNADWGGLPSKEFLMTLDPRLAPLRDRLYEQTYTADNEAGKLDPEVAKKLGLPAGISVAVGAFDAHMGAVGSGVKPGTLVKIMGTSCCDISVAPIPEDGHSPLIPGMCGVVNGSVIGELLGIEAGQSAVGDLYSWFVSNLTPASFTETGNPHKALTEAAAKLKPGQSGLIALDWNNGNRTILVDQRLTGLLLGQTLYTAAPEIYRALIEATAFGALMIIERMEEYGAKVEEIVFCGGISEKNPFLLQVYADVCNRTMKVSRSGQTCALGAAIFGSVTGGAHQTVKEAVSAMTGVKDLVFTPNLAAVPVYAKLFSLYKRLHDSFAGADKSAHLGDVMKQLLAIKEQTQRL